MDSEKIEKKAFDYFQSGFHCAESILKAILEQYAEEPDSEIPKMASGLVGGIGGTHEDICGALAGGIIAIGYLFGRTKPGADIRETREIATEFRRRFIAGFGSTNCGVLLEGIGKQENMIKCKRLTAGAAGLLSEILAERKELRDVISPSNQANDRRLSSAS